LSLFLSLAAGLIKSGPKEKEFINNKVKEFEEIVKEFKEWSTFELTGFCKIWTAEINHI